MGKRIALVANSTWNIYNFRQNIIQKLIAEGHDVYVIAPIDEYISYKEQFPEVKHLSLRTLDRDSVNPIKDILLALELYRRYKKLQLDFVLHYTHKPNIYGSLAARWCGIRSVSVVTGLGYSFIRKGWLQKVMLKLYAMSAGTKELMIFENTDDRDLFVQRGIVAEDKAVSVAGCGVDTNFFTEAKSQKTHDHLTFTFIGRLLQDKGIREFAGAAKIVKALYKERVKFVVLGDFDPGNPATIDREALLSWINEDIIDYKGFVKDVRPFIAESDCIVLPSYREGMPRIVLEGLAMSKPIITTLTAGCRETVEHGRNGFLIKSHSINDLVEAIEAFVALSPSQQEELGAFGRTKAVQQFDSNIIANHIYRLIALYL